eukprot:3601887-Rhodomonas_salina.1
MKCKLHDSTECSLHSSRNALCAVHGTRTAHFTEWSLTLHGLRAGRRAVGREQPGVGGAGAAALRPRQTVPGTDPRP